MSERKEKPSPVLVESGKSALARMMDLTRRIVAVPKSEADKKKPTKRKRH